MRILNSTLTIVLFFAGFSIAGEPVQVEIPASRDGGFFNEGVNRNLGAHTHVACGQTNDDRINRCVFDFPIIATIPSGATIQTATFEFRVTRQGGNDPDEQSPAFFEIVRITTDWAEGTGTGNMGQNTGDGATWLDADPINNSTWNSAGGDFDAASLGSVFVDNEGVYEISSPQLADVIQGMIDGQFQPLGFLMKGVTNVPGSAARVATREFGSPARLIIEYVLDTVVLGDVNLDGEVNLLDVAPFVALLSSGGFQAEADINQDGAVNLLDVAPFVDLLSGG